MKDIKYIVEYFLNKKSFSKNIIDFFIKEYKDNIDLGKEVAGAFLYYIKNLINNPIETYIFNIHDLEFQKKSIFPKLSPNQYEEFLGLIDNIICNSNLGKYHLGKHIINNIKSEEDIKKYFNNNSSFDKFIKTRIYGGYISIIKLREAIEKLKTISKYKSKIDKYMGNIDLYKNDITEFVIPEQFYQEYSRIRYPFDEFLNDVRIFTTATVEHGDVFELIESKIKLAEKKGDIFYKSNTEVAINLTSFDKAQTYSYDICFNMNGEKDSAVWCVARDNEKFNEYYNNGKNLLLLVIKKDGYEYTPYMVCIRSINKKDSVSIADIRNIENRYPIEKIKSEFGEDLYNKIIGWKSKKSLKEIVNYFLLESKEDDNYYKPRPYNQWIPVLIAKGFIKKNTGGNRERSNYLTVHTVVGDVNIDGTTIYGMLKIAGNNKNFYNKLLTQSKDNSNLFEPININDYYSEIKKFVEENPNSKNNVNHTLIPQAFYNIVINHKN